MRGRQNLGITLLKSGVKTSMLDALTKPVPSKRKNYSVEIAGYNPKFDFKTDLEYGHEGEQNLIDFFTAFNEGTVEVKADRYRNGRMAVETEQNPGGAGWKVSGINVTEATWWAYRYAPDAFIIVSVKRLKNYLRANRETLPKRDFASSSSNPAKGFLLYPQHIQDLQTNQAYD